MRKYLSSFIITSCVILVFGIAQLIGASGTPSTLVVRTDANNYLLVSAVTQTNPVTQGVFSSRTLRTDSSGNLQVILTGTITPTYPLSIPASTCAAPSLGESGATTTGIAFTATPSILDCISGTARTTLTGSLYTVDNDTRINGGLGVNTSETTDGTIKSTISNVTSAFQLNGTDINTSGTLSNVAYLSQANLFTALQTITRTALASTSTDGLIIQNTTAATSGATVQMSPRAKFRGNIWSGSASQTVDFWWETLPVASSNSLFKLGYSLDGGAATYPLTVRTDGNLTLLNGGIIAPGGVTVNAVGAANIQLNTGNSASAYLLGTRAIISQGAMSVASACTSPTTTWTTGSLIAQFDVGSSCTGISTIVINNGFTATNGHGCYAVNISALSTRQVRLTAVSTTQMTFVNYDIATNTATDFTNGDDIRVFCVGG